MTISVDIYKGVNKLGSGTATAGSAAVTAFSTVNGNVVGSGRNVQVTMTTGNNIGASFNTRVLTDDGATLTLSDPIPFS